ncbi:MAG: hypothetical protein OHM56_08270 [Spiroplasma phoeniceum]|nr:MAG: hypothetical protein OHM57_07675 [Spiroplasma phoeniceum]UZQ31614.1 MAG: hypothetical protein OHM56_08270 [Spiroplasma phoeniceum]
MSLDENYDYILDLVNAGNPPEKYKSGYKFALYRWDGNGGPQTPKINHNTGKITDWKD